MHVFLTKVYWNIRVQNACPVELAFEVLPVDCSWDIYNIFYTIHVPVIIRIINTHIKNVKMWELL